MEALIYSINDIINSSILTVNRLTLAYKTYNFDIKTNIKLSKKLDKKIYKPKTANLIKKDILDNILANSVWAITNIKNYEDFKQKENKVKRGLIKITARLLNNKNIITIEDNGCGIEKENISKIFTKRFSTKKTPGHGLYYAKKTIEKLKGDIKVESKKDKGTKTTIILK